MSQMPDSVYMHKDAKYNTVGIETVYSEGYLLADNDFNDECLKDYVEYTPVYRLEEEVRHSKQQMIENFFQFLIDNCCDCLLYHTHNDEEIKELIKEAME